MKTLNYWASFPYWRSLFSASLSIFNMRHYICNAYVFDMTKHQNNGFQLYLHLCLCLALDFNWNKHFQTTKDNEIKIPNFNTGPKIFGFETMRLRNHTMLDLLGESSAKDWWSTCPWLQLYYSVACVSCAIWFNYLSAILHSYESVLIILDMKCSGKRDAKSTSFDGDIRTYTGRMVKNATNSSFMLEMVSQWTYGFCCQRQLWTTPFDTAFLSFKRTSYEPQNRANYTH